MGILNFILAVIYILICAVLVTVILMQSSKGGGLSSTFGGQAAGTLFGPRSAASALSTITQYLAGAFLVLSLILSLLAGAGSSFQSVTQKVLETAPAAQLPPIENIDIGQTGGLPATSTPSEPAEKSAEPDAGE